jgi:signal peptidase II
MRTAVTRLVSIGAAIFAVGCDHATKAAARAALEGRPAVALLPGVLDLRYAENRDAAFSIGRSFVGPGKHVAMIVLPTVALALVLVAWLRTRATTRAQEIGYALVVAGAVGNLVDRVQRGFVVDFIELHHWPVFNVADVAVVVGAALVVVGSRVHAAQKSR